MSALVLKMTTAASPIIHHNKKPYYCHSHPLHKSNLLLPHRRFPNPLSPPRSAATYSTKPIINNNNNNKENKRGWWRIAPCAPLAHNTTHNNNKNNYFFSFLNQQQHHHHFGGPRFVAQHKCLCVSDRSENKGEITGSAGVMAGMGSENNHKGGSGQEWYESQLHQTKDPLLKPKHNQQQNHSSSKFLTLPTILTLGRVAAVPLLISTFYVDSWWGKTATTSIFIAAAITDWLDGYLARRMRLGSAFGAFLDPVADKLMVAATLVLLCSKPMDVAAFGQVPWLFVVPSIAIIGREITMSAVREWAASQNTKLLEAVAVNNLGKWKTASQMIALTILLATRDSSLGGPQALVVSGVVLLYISAGLAVWSLGVYMSKIWKVLLK